MNDDNTKEIEKSVNNLMKIEDAFNEMDIKMDLSVNRMIQLRINKDMSNDLNFIN